MQAPAGVVDDPVVESFGDRAVVGEGLQLRYAVSARPSARHKAFEVDRVLCTSLPISD
jgi:hypothetical protein